MYRAILALSVALAGATFMTLPAQADDVKCESRKFDYRECRTDIRRPRVARQISKTPCISGETWGFQRGRIWVDRGCAAVFSDSRRDRDRPRWRDRDRHDGNWDDNRRRRRDDDRYDDDY
jgi:hypothetical protein